MLLTPIIDRTEKIPWPCLRQGRTEPARRKHGMAARERQRCPCCAAGGFLCHGFCRQHTPQPLQPRQNKYRAGTATAAGPAPQSKNARHRKAACSNINIRRSYRLFCPRPCRACHRPKKTCNHLMLSSRTQQPPPRQNTGRGGRCRAKTADASPSGVAKPHIFLSALSLRSVKGKACGSKAGGINVF